ncbi:hypothetical protein VP01_162g7 [Puccinia sorghi]|uniref:DDE Tnp4 domain-containing protein n=1 Tax=Puccinia sorghi TaxID=27349 RepID=A0A0L6VGU8_9BASI|nr:hypothetical protein VP01_162g7 [Puccinia sorghi]
MDSVFQVSGGGPGSMHDSRIFRRSCLGQRLIPWRDEGLIIPENSYLVGDAGYPANVNILVPHPSVVSPANKWFSFLQSSTRIIVKQAFGWLKNHFLILLNSQNALPIWARNNTLACFVLHNLFNRKIYMKMINKD